MHTPISLDYKSSSQSIHASFSKSSVIDPNYLKIIPNLCYIVIHDVKLTKKSRKHAQKITVENVTFNYPGGRLSYTVSICLKC